MNKENKCELLKSRWEIVSEYINCECETEKELYSRIMHIEGDKFERAISHFASYETYDRWNFRDFSCEDRDLKEVQLLNPDVDIQFDTLIIDLIDLKLSEKFKALVVLKYLYPKKGFKIFYYEVFKDLSNSEVFLESNLDFNFWEADILNDFNCHFAIWIRTNITRNGKIEAKLFISEKRD